MNFFKFFTSIFDSLFKSSSEDGKIKSELKRIENELKLHVPAVYKNGSLLANVAEAFVLLYVNTKYIEEILSSTIKSTDLHRSTHYANKLLMTGFTTEILELRERLSFENRKAAVVEAKNQDKAIEKQTQDFQYFLQVINQEEFTQINAIIAKLYQLCDICRFNFIGAIRAFVPTFSDHTDLEKMEIKNVPVTEFETTLADLYYIAHNFQITSSMAKAIIALASLHSGEKQIDQDKILDNLKKISYVFRHVLQPATIHQLIMVARQNPAAVLENATYTCSALANFIEQSQKQFEADTNRIRIEVQDETVASEIKSLFGDRELDILTGYDAEQNDYFIENGTVAFSSVTPMQILKTFLAVYLGPHIKSLLNDIVIEGFFYNPAFKTEFSSAVFAALEAHERLQDFETSFDRNQPNDIAVIRSYVADSHADPDFLGKLTQSVAKINSEAKKIIQEEVGHLQALHKFLTDMIEDSKLINPVNITNIKVLLASSRNKDNTAQLENQLGDWHQFFSIMKHYTIVGETEKQ